MTVRLFELREPYTVGINFAEKIIRQIPHGRVASASRDLGVLSQCIVNAYHGDYIEIGTLFGGSAILAAMVKDEFNIDGKVVCLDPLDGYYGKGNKYRGVVPTSELLLKNADHFKVKDRLEIVQKYSIPFPEELENREFVCAFIDGDHWKDAPLKDWISLHDKVSKYIIFDNYDIEHPDVISACIEASQYSGWTPVYISGLLFILEKEVPFKNPHSWASQNYD